MQDGNLSHPSNARMCCTDCDSGLEPESTPIPSYHTVYLETHMHTWSIKIFFSLACTHFFLGP